MTKQELIELFVDNHTVTGADFTNLINSFKAMQTAVSDPTASGKSLEFIATISQNTEGKITNVTKKTVDLDAYQSNDVQITGDIETDGSGADITTSISHKKGHYPTVRVMDDRGNELVPTRAELEPFHVMHSDNKNLVITLAGSLNTPGAKYTYILD